MIVELSVFSWINVLKKSWVERKSQTRKSGQGIQSEKIFHRDKIWVLSDSSCEDGRINRVEISPMKRKSQYYHILTSKLAWLYCVIRMTWLYYVIRLTWLYCAIRDFECWIHEESQRRMQQRASRIFRWCSIMYIFQWPSNICINNFFKIF